MPLAMRMRAGRLRLRGRRGAASLWRNRKLVAAIFDTGNGVRKSLTIVTQKTLCLGLWAPETHTGTKLTDSQTDNKNNTRGL